MSSPPDKAYDGKIALPQLGKAKSLLSRTGLRRVEPEVNGRANQSEVEQASACLV